MTEKREEIKKDENKLSFIYYFFCWCSGARLYLLEKCPSDFNKYFGIGIIIFLTGIMASISGGYALYTVFNMIAPAIIFGIFWGVLIFFIDWYLVASLKKENKVQREISVAAPRLILAVFLAVVIAKPLEIRLFEKEINRNIETNKRTSAIDHNKLINVEFAEIDSLKLENKLLYSELQKMETERKKLFDMTIAEAEGQSITGRSGKGPVYKEKKQELENIERIIKEQSVRFLPIVESNNKRIIELRTMRDNQVAISGDINKEYDGFLARLEAMGNLSNENPLIYKVNIFIILLFICIESLPVLVKLMAKRGPYDVLYEAEEEAKFEEVKEKSKANQAYFKTDLDFDLKIAQSLGEINNSKIDKWKENKLDEIKNGY